MTIALWIKRLALSNVQNVITKTNGMNGYEIYLSDTAKIIFRINGNSNLDVLSSTTIPTAWTHVAAVHDGTKLMLYINGVLESTLDTTVSIITNTRSVDIGRHLTGTPDQWFRGHLDDIRIYNRVLTPAEITLLKNMAQPMDFDPPTAPEGLTSSLDGTNVILNWTANGEPGIQYNVFRGVSLPVQMSTRLNPELISGTTFIDSNPLPVGTYFYVVSAVDASLNRSAASNTVSNAPTAVTISSFNAVSNFTGIRFTWVTATEVGLVGFNILRSLSVEELKIPITSTMVPAEFPNQLMGSTYHYQDPGNLTSIQYYWLELFTTCGNQIIGPIVPTLEFSIGLPLIAR
jgi:hypothetical protein